MRNLALSLGWCAMALTGCNTIIGNDGGQLDLATTLFIRQVNSRGAPGGGCVVDNSPQSLFLTTGTLDVALRLQYSGAILVGLQPTSYAAAGISLQNVTVRVQDASGRVLWGPVDVPASGFIDSAPDHVTYGTTDAILLGSEFGATLADELHAQPGLVRHVTSFAQVTGQTTAGITIESHEWRFPIEVCYGCLLTFPPEADDPKSMTHPNCDLVNPQPTAPCVIGQEDGVDCRTCKQFLPTSTLCDPPM